jgi:DNA-binding NtrC family response regulator
MPEAKVLIIDDEPSVCYSFRRALEKHPYQVKSASNMASGLEMFASVGPDVVVLDINLPDGSGMDVFRRIRELNPRCPVLFITAHGTTQTALEAMKEGAFDYLIKPVNLERLCQLLERALEASRLANLPPLLPASADEGIIGHSPLMQEMCKMIGLLAPQDVNVLILGESGVGKELVARALYKHSRRGDRPFLAINCAALPEHILESELFGHEQGAFTGAQKQRIGKFEHCRDGTLFLDEIGDMSLAVQAKMLRVLQDQRFERLGGNQVVQTNVRLLAATNQNLEQRVADGKFRADLYYRLKVATIHVPPLRERREDIAPLANHFVGLARANGHPRLQGVSTPALECLTRYSWPGNVRELQSILKEAVVRTRGPLVLPEYLPEHVRSAAAAATPVEENHADLNQLIAALQAPKEDHLYDKVFRAVDLILLTEIMRQTGGNQVRASEILGIDRKTLRHKLRNLGLVEDRAPRGSHAERETERL